MFEITVSTSKSRNKDIDFIRSFLKNKIKSQKGLMASEEIDGRTKLAIAVSNEKKDFVLSLLFDAIAEVIVRNYKYEFFKKNITLQTSNVVLESVFIKALSVYDKESDKDFIKKQLKPSDEILIDSFCQFRLWELEKRWRNIADLMTENATYMSVNSSLSDLMRFLVASCDCGVGEVHIRESDSIIFCEDLSKKELFNMIYDDSDVSAKINIINELISILPEKIIVHKELDGCALANEIVNVFGEKVVVLKKWL